MIVGTFCIIVYTMLNSQIISSVVLPDCYLTMKACKDDIPRRAAALVPETHTMIGFNCAAEEKGA